MRSTHRVEHYGGTVGTSNAEGAVSALAATVLLSPNAITERFTGNPPYSILSYSMVQDS